jgi:hypothetical protein
MKSKLSIALLVVAMLIQAALCFGGETLVIATQELIGERILLLGPLEQILSGEGALKTLDAVAGDAEAWKQVWNQLYKEGKVVSFPKGTQFIKTGDNGWFGKLAYVKPVNSLKDSFVVYRAYLQPVEK